VTNVEDNAGRIGDVQPPTREIIGIEVEYDDDWDHAVMTPRI